MTNLFRSTAQAASLLLAGCSLVLIVAGVAQGHAIHWATIGASWLVGWPVLFVGFTVSDLAAGSESP